MRYTRTVLGRKATNHKATNHKQTGPTDVEPYSLVRGEHDCRGRRVVLRLSLLPGRGIREDFKRKRRFGRGGGGGGRGDGRRAKLIVSGT